MWGFSSLFSRNTMSLDTAIQKALQKGNIRCHFERSEAKLYTVQDTVIDFRGRVSACSIAMLSAIRKGGIILHDMDEPTCMKAMQDFAQKHHSSTLLLPDLRIALKAVGYKLTPEEKELSRDCFNAKVLATYTYTQTFLPESLRCKI